MSYNKMMKWNKNNPKGTKQPCLFHTNSGFTPSKSFLEKYFIYKEKCEKNGLIALSCEEYYNSRI